MAQSGQRKILIAVDGSPSAERAFDWYLENVHKANDYVYCITVPEYSLSGITVGPLADTDKIMKEFNEKHEKVQKMCSDYTAKLRGKNCAGQSDPIPGDKPGIVICDQANSLGVDLIIMGTRGLGKVKSWMVGSVSQYVVQNSGKPVSIIPENK